MARWANDGMLRVVRVPSIANIAAPTVAEVAAGTHITNFITKDGLTTPANQNFVDNSSLAETFDAQVVGSFGGPISLTGIRDNTTDTLWDLIVYGLGGFLWIRRGIATARRSPPAASSPRSPAPESSSDRGADRSDPSSPYVQAW